MLSRRALIGKAAVGAAAAVALGAARTGIASTRALSTAPDGSTDKRDPRANAGDGRQAVAPPTEAAAAQPEAEAVAITGPPPWDLVRPFVAGAVVAHGWRLFDLSPVRDGSCVVTLENGRGGSHRIHLCQNDGQPQGLVYTRRMDLVVMNGGQGALPTEEGLAQAVAALAHVVAANEAKQADGFFADLLPHSERVRRFAAAEGPAADGKLR
jgi:hypothetical protein